jgi:rsbT co-antagonist protein RsbR
MGVTMSTELALPSDLGLTAADLERRKWFVGLGPEDLARIASVRDVVRRSAEDASAAFFDALRPLDEARGLFSDRDAFDEARRMKLEHLRAMADGDYGVAYVEQRVELGRLYGRTGLEPRVLLGAFRRLLATVGGAITRQPERGALEAFEAYTSLEKVAFFDVGIIFDVLSHERERALRHEQAAIRDLTTPVLPVRDHMLLLPIIGVIDTHRARLVTEKLLRAIRAHRAKVVMMDVTGVAALDSKVANHLLQTISAARLMGADVIVTGLSSDVAQSLVVLGIDVTKLNTAGDLQAGLEEAQRLLGFSSFAPAEGVPREIELE